MTREEAIEYGKEQLEIFGGDHAEFIRMAIKALQTEQKIIDETNRYVNDFVFVVDGRIIVARERRTT